jgi:uncharacterized protein (TIGR04222 family)
MWLIFLVPACAAAVLACARLCRIVAAEPAGGALAEHTAEQAERIGIFETAYLAGGPDRVVDLALVRMARRGRLHLAHTGWTTVVRPEPRNALEEEVLAAIGPEGQCPTAELRRAVADGGAVREIAARLARAGLAVPAMVRERTAAAVRRVWYALWLTIGCLVLGVAVAYAEHDESAHSPGAVAAWFGLPLILTSGTLLMSRIDVYPYTRWAAPAGQEVLRALGAPARRAPVLGRAALDDEPWQTSLTEIAIAGTAAVRDPRLRAALRPPRTV